MFVFANNAATTLAQSLTANPADTTVYVVDTVGFPTWVPTERKYQATLTNRSILFYIILCSQHPIITSCPYPGQIWR